MFKVFYSWQSDLERKYHQYFIRDALRNAVEALRNNPDESIELRLDSDTVGQIGSPNIIDSIFSKIDSSDIFVADVSIINPNQEGRKTPNPNVLFELGYASRKLGWERIICVFNRSSGELPNDLPFDLRPRRITDYVHSENKTENSAKQRELQKVLEDAINRILDTNPHTPYEIDVDNKRRKFDIMVLQKIVDGLNIETFKWFFSMGATGYMNRDVISHWDYFNSIVSSPDYHLYDVRLSALVDDFYKNWENSMSFGNYFFHTTGAEYKFEVTDEQSKQSFQEFSKSVFLTETSLREL